MAFQKTPDFPKCIFKNELLSQKTYYQMGGTAQYFAIPESISQIQDVLFWAQQNNLPIALLGSGSNSVFADGVFPGVVISSEKLNHWHWESPEYLFVEAGVSNTEVSEICAAANRQGASWMYRMPGQIGATVRMNARCYGGEISQIAQEIITINACGVLKTQKAHDVFLGYKDTSLMSSPEIVVAVRFHFPNTSTATQLITHMHECEADRHRKNHFYLPSCGSTFKNNYAAGKPSGQIFDELHLKGTKVGHAEVSQFHANFIWNTGHASTHDMLELAAHMRHEALARAHVELNLEVQPIGLFDQELYQKCGMEKCGPAHEDPSHKKWVGLFSYPEKKASAECVSEKQKTFPLKILECPFVEYKGFTVDEMPLVRAQITQLRSVHDAQKNPDKPFLQWLVQSHESVEKIFTLSPSAAVSSPDLPSGLTRGLTGGSTFLDHLWNYSVAELFVANIQNPNHYFEFEVTPCGHWLALEFENVRQRTQNNTVANELLWPGVFIEKLNNNQTFGMSFTFEQIQPLLLNDKKNSSDNTLLIQCALSLGNSKYFLAPYWNLNEKEVVNGKYDFHQPSRFWEVLLF